MKDQPLTAEQTARWLECAVEDLPALVSAGLLKPFGAEGSPEAEMYSLNAVVMLAESLPVERGIFKIRETGMAGGEGGGAPGGPKSYSSAPRPHGERSGFVVERRSPPPRRV